MNCIEKLQGAINSIDIIHLASPKRYESIKIAIPKSVYEEYIDYLKELIKDKGIAQITHVRYKGYELICEDRGDVAIKHIGCLK